MAHNDVPYPSLDTPSLLVDMDRLEANIREMSSLAAEAGLKLRPHTKIHECADIAKMQIDAGACGVSTAKLAEAESMAEAGIDDAMVVHPFYGHRKMEALKALLERPGFRISVVVDMMEQAEAISEVGAAVGQEVPILLKIDTGVGRFGCLPGVPALDLAKGLRQLPGTELVGIVAHESAMGERTTEAVERMAFEVASATAETARLLRKEGIAVSDVVVGASPTFRATCRLARQFPEITEVHPGAMVIGDVSYINSFSNTEDSCALAVLTTVVSTPAPGRAVIDAGGKTFGADPLMHLRWKPDYLRDGRPRYGQVKGRSDLWLGRLSAEVGVVYATDASAAPGLGERLEILPNNAILAFNLHDEAYGVRNGEVERVFQITGRGKGN